MGKTVIVVGTMALAMLLACVASAQTAVPSASRARTVTLVGAGDIAGCDFSADYATAKLLGRIPGTVFTLGDNVYPSGSRAQFRDCYGPPGASTRSAPSPRRATKTTNPRGQAILRLLREGRRRAR